MVDGPDSDDGGGQRGIADGEPSEPSAAPDSGAFHGAESAPAVTLDLEPGAGVGRDEAAWVVDRLGEAVPVACPTGKGSRIHRISVRVVGDESMSEAHRRWCDLDGTTDVLTFHGIEEDGLHIDLLICVDEARRRAAEFGHDVRRELLLYSIHGLLHCLGHDDHDAESFERMHDEEDRVLREIGVGPVCRPGEAS